MFRTAKGALSVGPVPRVAGALSSLPKKFTRKVSCDIVEVRLDKTSRPADWLDRCRSIEATGVPVLLTIRLSAEGGEWSAPDESRLELFQQGLRHLAAVDVELHSVIARVVGKTAAKLGKACIVSFHDFQKTPPLSRLQAIVRKAQKIGSVVKISTRIQSESDLNNLRALLTKKWKCPLCVIGMGADWRETRVSLPLAGSCLTYGYLDKPTAPGQMSAATLSKRLRNALQQVDAHTASR